VLVVAERQTAGRGRTGHDWQTAPRAVAASLALRTRWQPSEQTLVPLIAGLAARRAVGNHTRVNPRLKWPNDLVTDAGKVGGLLVEATDGIILVGCGVNLWWPQPPPGFGGVLTEDPGPGTSVAIARDWADSLVPTLLRPEGRWDRTGYVAACETIGQEITWEPGGGGVAVDIDPAGGLVVETATGQVTLRSGSVRNVRAATLAADSSGEGSDT
jgi:BirA family biotin operon repressor/biotin-[acetyl-CoA-carboxylase] ligase